MALMAIVREIEQNIIHGVIQLDKFKIVYVAPMKVRWVERLRIELIIPDSTE